MDDPQMCIKQPSFVPNLTIETDVLEHRFATNGLYVAVLRWE